MAGTIFLTVSLETTTCCECGIPFGVPDYLLKKLQESGKGFYCPNGHSLVFKKSEVTKLREDLIREKSAREQAEAIARELQVQKAQLDKKLTRLKNRVKNGVCPCCNRHFSNLQRHMETKHKTVEQKQIT